MLFQSVVQKIDWFGAGAQEPKLEWVMDIITNNEYIGGVFLRTKPLVVLIT